MRQNRQRLRGLLGVLALTLVACGGSPKNETGRVVTTDTKIERLDSNPFLATTIDFKPDADRYLNALVTTLAGNPDIRELRVICRASAGDVDLATATARARAIVARLVSLGTATERLSVGEPVEGAGDQCDFRIERRDE